VNPDQPFLHHISDNELETKKVCSVNLETSTGARQRHL